MAEKDNVGQALTGEYWGEMEDGTPDYERWGKEWTEAVPLNGMNPKDYMRTRPAGEEGATFKNPHGGTDLLFIRKKPSDAPLTS